MSEEDYIAVVRSAIQKQAFRWNYEGQGFRVDMAIREVKRLDEKFDFTVV